MPDVSLNGIEFTIKGSSDAASKSIDKLTQKLDKLKSSVQAAPKVSILSKTLGIMKADLDKVSGSLGKFGKFALKYFSYPIRTAYKDVKGFTKSISGAISGFKRILGYRMVRTIIKEIGQAFKEGTDNLYQWSTLVGGQFAKNMDDAATSMLYFKNSLGAMWSPLMNVLAPALRVVTDAAVNLMNAINQMLAILTGQSSWTRAKRMPTTYADVLDDTAEAAKKAMHYLAPFDELNVLPDQSEKSGGGAGDIDYSEMFEEVEQFDEKISSFAESIKKAFQDADWQGLGTLIGGKFNDLVDGVNWSGLGSKIGEKINAWFTTEYWTLNTINFKNIGKKIAELLTGEDGVGGALREIDFSNIGGIIAEKLTILPDIVIGAIENVDAAAVGESIRSFVTGFFNQLTDWFGQTNWEDLGNTLFTKITEIFSWENVKSMASSIWNFLSAAWEAAKGLSTGFWKAVFSEETWNAVVDISIEIGKELFNVPEVDTDGVPEALSQALDFYAEKIENAVEKVKLKFNMLVGWFQDLPAQLKQTGIDVVNALLVPVQEAVNKFIEDHPKLAEKLLGLTEPVEMQIQIPNIPEEELHKHYNDAKAKYEAFCAETPPQLTADVTKLNDKIVNKTIDGVSGKMTAINTEALTKPIILSTAKLDGYTTTLTKANGKKPSLATTAKFDGFSNTLTKANSKKPVLPTTAKFDGYSNTLTKANSKKPAILSTAKFDAFTNTLTAANKKKPSISSTAYLSSYLKDANIDGKPQVKSQAYLSSYVKGAIGTPDINSRGVIVDTVKSSSLTMPQINTGGIITKMSINANTLIPNVDVDAEASVNSASVAAGVSVTIPATAVVTGTVDTTPTPPTGTDTSNWYDVKTCPDCKKTNAATRTKCGYCGYPLNFVNAGKSEYPPDYYSKGGFPNTGELYWARENGISEMVGRIGNRHAVVNNDQIVASVSNGIARTLAGIRLSVAAPAATTSPMSNGMADEETMYRAFRRALDETDFGGDVDLDGEVLYRAMVRRNSSNTRMTGVNAIAMG